MRLTHRPTFVSTQLEAAHTSAVGSLCAAMVLASGLFYRQDASEPRQTGFEVTQKLTVYVTFLEFLNKNIFNIHIRGYKKNNILISLV